MSRDVEHTAATDIERLRHMVDQHGLSETVSMLSTVCDEKEEEADFQQEGPRSKDWRQAGERLESLAVKLEPKFGG